MAARQGPQKNADGDQVVVNRQVVAQRAQHSRLSAGGTRSVLLSSSTVFDPIALIRTCQDRAGAVRNRMLILSHHSFKQPLFFDQQIRYDRVVRIGDRP